MQFTDISTNFLTVLAALNREARVDLERLSTDSPFFEHFAIVDSGNGEYHSNGMFEVWVICKHIATGDLYRQTAVYDSYESDCGYGDSTMWERVNAREVTITIYDSVE